MADAGGTSVERLVLQVDTIVTGQEKLIALSQSMADVLGRQTAAMQQQASAATQLAAAMDRVPGKQIAVASTATAVATATDAVRNAFDFVRGAIEGAVEASNEILKTGEQFDAWQGRFEVFLGSPARAKAELERLSTFAETWNLPLPQVMEAESILRRVGITGTDALHAVAGASVTLGISMTNVAERLAGLSRGYTRSFLDLVPAASSAVLKAQNEIERGARQTPEALTRITQAGIEDLERVTKGGLEKWQNSTEAAGIGLANRMEAIRLRIYNAGWGSAMARAVGELTAQIDRLVADGTMQRWAETAAGGITFLSNTFIAGVRAMEPAVEVLRFVAPIAGTLALYAAITKLTTAMVTFAATTGVISAKTGLLTLGTAAQAAAAGVRALGVAFVTTFGVVGTIVTAAAVAVSAVLELHRLADRDMQLHINVSMAGADEVDRELQRIEDHQARIIAASTGVNAALAAMGLPGLPGFVDQANREAGASEAALAARRAVLRAQSAGLHMFGPDSQGTPADQIGKPRTKQDDAAFKDAVAHAKQMLAEMERDSDEATRIVTEGIKDRLQAADAEGRDKLTLFDMYSKEELASLVKSGALEQQMERDNALKAERARAAVIATYHDPAVRAELLRDIAEKEKASEAAIRASFASGDAQQKIETALAKERAELVNEQTREATKERVRLTLQEAASDQRTHHWTTEQYLAELRRRRDGFATYTAEYLALDRRIREVEATRAQRSEVVGQYAADYRAAGVPPGQAEAIAGLKADSQQVSEFMRAQDESTFLRRVDLLDQFVGIHDKAWSDMSDAEKRAHADNVRLAQSAYAGIAAMAKNAFATMKVAATDFLNSEVTRLEVVQFFTQKNAKEAIAVFLDQKAQEFKVYAIESAILALIDIAKGNFAGAAAAAEAAALAGGEAIAVGALAREYHALAIQAGEEPGRGAAYGNAGGGGSGRGAQASTLPVSAGNQPITYNVTSNVSFEGGVYFMGRATATDLVNQISDAINSAIKDHRIGAVNG